MKCLPVYFTAALILFACHEPKPTAVQWSSMEVFHINGKDDTLNRIDANGMKQGKWIPSPTNQLKDTVYFLNDSAVKG